MYLASKIRATRPAPPLVVVLWLALEWQVLDKSTEKRDVRADNLSLRLSSDSLSHAPRYVFFGTGCYVFVCCEGKR